MIKPKKLSAVIIGVRDLEKSLAWYKEHLISVIGGRRGDEFNLCLLLSSALSAFFAVNFFCVFTSAGSAFSD